MQRYIDIDNYDYGLDESRIAQFAIEPRDSSKLLVYEQGEINDAIFSELTNYLDTNSTLFYNNAKVIPARLFLKNKNEANIEVFLLKPYGMDHASALNAKALSVWECLIGNSKKWKLDEVLRLNIVGETIDLHRKENNVVEFHLSGTKVFSEMLEQIGRLPLPPYIKHDAGVNDEERYQTVYAQESGSVAAPTAGLHFTDAVMQAVESKGIARQTLTLHVSAGTFLPVKVKNALEHNMHSEVFEITKDVLNALRMKRINVAVGTTSCRVLESLYWVAKNLKAGKEQAFFVEQYPYFDEENKLTIDEVCDSIEKAMTLKQVNRISGVTSIMISPGYEFKIVNELITNFHQPKSTLLMLVSAFVGEDWSVIYKHALANGYRFLSYGDSSILKPKRIF
jgi:S-adenosylmethionine:tRNA ribosyltransferase-isomerase